MKRGAWTAVAEAGRRALAALALLALAGGSAAAGAAEGTADRKDLDLDYSVYLGGVNVIELDIELVLDGLRYDLHAAMETQGLAGRLFPWSMRAHARGQVEPTRLRPVESHSESTWRGEKGWVTMRFDGDGPRIVSAEPERDPGDVSPDLLREAIDVGSAILAISRSVESGRACGAKIPVFDGRRRFDFVLDRLGDQEMARNRYSAFAGTAVRCKVGMEVLHGKGREGDYGGFGSGGRTVTMWMGTIFEGVLPMPVRIEYETRWGHVVAHLAVAKIRVAGREKVLSRIR